MLRPHHFVLCLCLLLAGACSAPEQQDPRAAGLAIDHIPVAVWSLDAAQVTYAQALGFTLKPGRVHSNGLRNSFAKFADGSYLELISPERGEVDELSGRYADILSRHEGGAFLALRADTLESWVGPMEPGGRRGRLQSVGPFSLVTFDDTDLEWLFLIEYNEPVLDPPELLQHGNTAVGILDVWLQEPAYEAASAAGFVHPGTGIQRGLGADATRPVVSGVTVQVESIETVQSVIREGNVGEWPIRSDALGRSIHIPAINAHGLAIEFRELRERVSG